MFSTLRKYINFGAEDTKEEAEQTQWKDGTGSNGYSNGDTDKENEKLDDDDDDDATEVKIPMVNVGANSMKIPERYQNDVDAKNGVQDDNDAKNKMEGVGVITSVNFSMRNGVIDRKYKFEMALLCTDDSNILKGCTVEFQAERNPAKNRDWEIVSIKIVEMPKEENPNAETHFVRFKAKIQTVSKTQLVLETDDSSSGHGGTVKLPKVVTFPYKEKFELGPEKLWLPGDWVDVCLKAMDYKNIDKDLPEDCVLEVTPLERKTVVGKVTKVNNTLIIDGSILFTDGISKYQFPVGSAVKCEAIKSIQMIGEGPPYNQHQWVQWRAVSVQKSNFLRYSDPFAIIEKGESPAQLAEQQRKLEMDKGGIKISPRVIKFPTLEVAKTCTKNFTIQNTTTSNQITLQKVYFQHDSTMVGFEVKIQNHEVTNVKVPLDPTDQLHLEVICTPKMPGRTTDFCVFDFGNFKIGRKIIVTVQSEEERQLVKEGVEERPRFKKQIGENDIERVITDRCRRRVRGNQAVRVPFFAQKRLALNKVPDVLYQIHKTQDEQHLRELYPQALEGVKYKNYKQKFQVALWFEEIEGDLRRRQYDLHRVVLKKLPRGEGKVFYIFQAPAIQDFQPPVNINDTIDAFKDDDAKNAKFQGTVAAINGCEVTCTFGETFDRQYTGFPVTIQFNLGRTNFKRCHHAVDTAYEFLGERFLFPDEQVIQQPSRINLIENGEAVQLRKVDSAIASPSNSNFGSPMKSSSSPSTSSTSVFRKFRPDERNFQSQSTSGSVAASASGDLQYRRAASVRSRFVSDTKSAPSCSEAKLEWFNSNLNEQQKNAVRRILQGQARPLPYIIFGPPGTGKTVTLVEAIMQVNKLDKNSRILVCAPSNAAADVLAECLAKSGHYAAGDFVRLNGFLRAGQAAAEVIAPFCTDGEELNKVAMHRLIISTCMTAGQFFTLDLSAGHFTHVFVDEAGCCTEPETLIPTVLLRVSKGGQLILAGDPKQLGPVLMSDVSQNCGLNISLLERLMERALYSRDENQFPDEKYNPLVLTKLVKNYRAHPTLLKLPSTLFYNDDLVPEAPFEEAYALCTTPPVKKLLVTEGVPIIFHGLLGQCIREKDSPSWCNVQEAVMVSYYVHTLKHSCGIKMEDIGIITPYRKQVEKIELALQTKLMNQEIPKVASVEEFQGGERKVIIISTVRSMQQNKIDGFLDRLSFIYQPKRFNVVITRAKALMIVIGNPHVLWKNSYWKKLLTYVIELNAYKGCNLPLEVVQLQKQLEMAQRNGQVEGRNGGLEGEAEGAAGGQAQGPSSVEKQIRNEVGDEEDGFEQFEDAPQVVDLPVAYDTARCELEADL